MQYRRYLIDRGSPRPWPRWVMPSFQIMPAFVTCLAAVFLGFSVFAQRRGSFKPGGSAAT